MAYHLVTSRAGDAVRKHLDLPPGVRHELCRLEGRGRIVRFWCAVPVFGQPHALEDLVLRMFWDGEEQPSVEAPLGDFFGASFGRPESLVSDKLVIAGGALLCRLELPFNDGARVEVTNDASSVVRTFFFQIGWYDEPTAAPRPTLHAQYRHTRALAGQPAVTLLEASGRGTLVGLRLDVQTQAWWLRPPLREMALPRGFGLGVLEGWESIVVDQQAPIEGTGAEDYFSGGFYFRGAPFCTPTHGCTARSFLLGRASAYRFHLDDPVHFERSLSMAIDHGLKNSMAGDYSSVAYWYQSEPHRAFAALPPARQRRRRWPWRQLAQWAAVAGLGAGALTALGWALALLR